MAAADQSLPGLRAAAVADWITAHVADVTPPVMIRWIFGGRSNLMFRVDDAAGRAWALRRPPTGELLATAHDMRREWDFVQALAGSDVPVPTAAAFCADPEVTGAPFYLTGWCDGTVLGNAAAGRPLSRQVRHAVAESTASVLGRLHRIDPQDVGLGGYARPGNYVERQLRRWQRQLHASVISDLRLADEVHDLLVARVPADVPPRIVHGDFRPGNAMYAADGTVLAVLDWELATLGDPLADLGWLLASWVGPDEPFPPVTETPTTAGGFPPAEVLLDAYRAAGGTEPGDLDFYLAFARWRAACVFAGVHTRDLEHGVTTGRGDITDPEAHLRALLEAARAGL